MKRLAFLLTLLVMSPLVSGAQESQPASLTSGTWIVEKVVTNPHEFKQDTALSRDSTFYHFRATEFDIPGYPKMPAVVQSVSFFLQDPLDEKMKLIHGSCPSYFGFLGMAADSVHNLVAAGEHLPYFARLSMLTDSTFTLTAIFPGDLFETRFYRRIPTPEFLK